MVSRNGSKSALARAGRQARCVHLEYPSHPRLTPCALSPLLCEGSWSPVNLSYRTFSNYLTPQALKSYVLHIWRLWERQNTQEKSPVSRSIMPGRVHSNYLCRTWAQIALLQLAPGGIKSRLSSWKLVALKDAARRTAARACRQALTYPSERAKHKC